ncbi:DUF4249 family protein [candidate division KSB1 bacterium]|nr:DUF4249 family protein [candidate division KSB1 bacterium]
MKRIILFIIIACLMHCERMQVMQPTPEQPVIIQAYLYADKPVRDIRVSTLNETGLQAPVSDAILELNRNDHTYRLSLSDTAGSYFYDGTDLTVTPGDTFQLNATVDSHILTATTIVPLPPMITSVSSDTFFMDSARQHIPAPYDSTRMTWEKVWNYAVEVNWTGDVPTADRFVVIINYDRSSLNFSPYYEKWGNSNKNKWAFHTYSLSLTKFIDAFPGYPQPEEIPTGNYRFYVYRVNKELTDLYDADLDPWGLGTTSFSNIKNGYGIFTALASDSVDIYVKGVME